MHADLMRSASINLHFDPGELAKNRVESTDYTIVRDGVAPIGSPRGHSNTANAVAADAGGNRSAILLRPAVYQREVGFLDLAAGKLRGQLAVRLVVFRDYDQPAGLFVEAVNDARAHLAAHSR